MMHRMMERALPGEELLLLTAGLSLAAGVIHLMVSPEHLSEWWGYGFFFMIAALVQLAYGLALFLMPWLSGDAGAFLHGTLPGVRALYIAGMVGNAAIVALWLMTRTVGIPVGPQAGLIEPLDAISVTATIIELTLVALLTLLAHRTVRQVQSPR